MWTSLKHAVRKKRLLLVGVSFVVLLGCTTVPQCTPKPDAYYGFVNTYHTATIVEPTEVGELNTPTKTLSWTQSLALSDGEQCDLLTAKYGSRVSVRYPDNEQEHVLHDFEDYVRAVEIRRFGDILFVEVSGLSSGILEKHQIVEFDLLKRQLLKVVRVDPEDLVDEKPRHDASAT